MAPATPFGLCCAKGVSTSCTVVTLFNVTEDLDVASFDCATIRTGFGVTPLPREFHDVFPPSQHDDTSNGLSWLGVPSEGFTAYVYSTKESDAVILLISYIQSFLA